MNQEYRLDREYSIAEIIQCNLRKWWLALICAADLPPVYQNRAKKILQIGALLHQ